MKTPLDPREERLARDWLAVQEAAGTPDIQVHPADDMYRGDVLGLTSERRTFEYLRSGLEARTVLKHVLCTAGRDEVGSLLEFACGYGRLVRWLVLDHDPDRIHVSDVLRPAVDFVGEQFGVHGLYSEHDADRVPLEHTYDVIWVGSLFSHLPRHRFEAMLAKLLSALEPDGLLIFTTHALDGLPEEERNGSDFVFRGQSESRVLDPAEYGSTFVEPALVAELARLHGAKMHACIERGIWRIQDLHVVSSTLLPSMLDLGPARSLRGAIAKIELTDRDTAWIGGWIRVPREFGPVIGVSLVVDGQHRFNAQFRAWTEELPALEGGARFRQTDWYVEGPLSALGPGDSTLVAVAWTEDGIREAFDAKYLRSAPPKGS